MDLRTLTELLKNLHEELEICMDNKQVMLDEKYSDPILLGDFIVDAYNNYLNAAKKASENPIVQGMPEIWRLTEADYADNSPSRAGFPRSIQGYDDREIPLLGGNPRLQKMREVALAAKQLKTILEGLIKAEKAEDHDIIAGVMVLLENLGTRIEYVQKEIKENQEMDKEFISPLITEYNQCLEIVLEDKKDPILAKMFHPVKAEVDETMSWIVILPELKLAQSGLLSYLQKTHERSR